MLETTKVIKQLEKMRSELGDKETDRRIELVNERRKVERKRRKIMRGDKRR